MSLLYVNSNDATGLVIKVLHATKRKPVPVPVLISAIQNAIAPSHLKAFAASDRAKSLRQASPSTQGHPT